MKFNEPQDALKSYSSAIKDYTEAQSPLKAAQNYMKAADLMASFKNPKKALNLLEKAQKQAVKAKDNNLIAEINAKMKSF